MNDRLDRWMANAARQVARRTSRRGFLSRLATAVVGGAALPLLPISRAHGATRAPIPSEPPAIIQPRHLRKQNSTSDSSV